MKTGYIPLLRGAYDTADPSRETSQGKERLIHPRTTFGNSCRPHMHGTKNDSGADPIWQRKKLNARRTAKKLYSCDFACGRFRLRHTSWSCHEKINWYGQTWVCPCDHCSSVNICSEKRQRMFCYLNYKSFSLTHCMGTSCSEL